MRKFTCFILAFILTSTIAFSGGYQVNLQGQKQIGMGVVGTAFITDASTLFYNPGGLTFLKKNNQFSMGLSLINSFAAFRKAAPSIYEAETNNPIGTPFYFYGAIKINEKFSVGLGVFTPYGNSLVWEEDWAGRYLIEDLSFQAIYFQPTVSYKINDKLGVGAGLSYVIGNVELNKALPVSGSNVDGQVSLNGTTASIGFSAGIYYQATEKLSLGFMYRSNIDMEMEEGDATFTVPTSLSTNFPEENKFSATLPLPENFTLGIAYQVNKKLNIGIDLQYVIWSVYDSLIFDFETNTSSLEDSRNARLYEDKLIIRVGGQYMLNEKLSIRAGGYYDPSPVKDDYLNPETPSTNQLGLTLGCTYQFSEKLSLDASFLYLQGAERDASYSPANFGGTYKVRTYIPGIGINYNF